MTKGMSSQRVLLELVADFLVQLHPDNKNIICGFRCDYNINFEIVRNSPQVPTTPLRHPSASAPHKASTSSLNSKGTEKSV
jgi:hypothetical protein